MLQPLFPVPVGQGQTGTTSPPLEAGGVSDITRRNQVSKGELKHLSPSGDSWGQQELC